MSATVEPVKPSLIVVPLPDTRHIREQVRGRWRWILAVLSITVPDGPMKHGPCPACGGEDRFRFDDKDGRGTWFCNQCVPQAGDGFSLVQNVRQRDFPGAKDLVARTINHNSEFVARPQQGPVTHGRSLNGSTCPPEGELGTNLFVYRNDNGEPIIYVQRVDNSNGHKQFYQCGPTADGLGWQRNLSCAPKPRPLYRLPEIVAAPNSLIVFHEGEKACEAAVKAGLPGIHTTTLGGALNPAQTDFALLKNRDVVICPDNDEPGEKYANAIVRLAHQAGAKSVKILNLPEQPLKGDVVEWLQGGGTAQTFSDFLKQAIICSASIDTEEERSTPPKALPSISSAVVDLEGLRSMALPERKRHLPWLPEGSIMMIYGARGIGKTMLQLSLGVSLASGTSFLKWPVTVPTGVLYVDGEMPLDELKSRITKLMPNQPGMLRFLTSDRVYQSSQRDLVLTSESMRAELDHFWDAHPEIRILILDNISRLFTGINEDKKQEWEPINAWLLRLRHRGLAIVLIHHAGKGGNQRGTSGREDALDTVIRLSLPANYDPKDGCHFELGFTKSRSVKGEDVAPLDVQLEEINGQLRWIYKPIEESNRDQVRRLLQEGVTSQVQISKELGIHKSWVSRLVRKVKAEKQAV